MYRYLIIIEPGEHNYSAYVPDLPGCITTGATYEEVQKNMREAIALHLRGMVEDHEPIPVPQTRGEYAEVPSQLGSLNLNLPGFRGLWDALA